MDEAVVFQQVVLNGRPGQQNSALSLQTVQRLVRLVLRVLQPVTLCTENDSSAFTFQTQGTVICVRVWRLHTTLILGCQKLLPFVGLALC